MVFYGASGHGKVIIESYLLSGGQVTAILDDNPEIISLLSHPVSGSYEEGRYPGASFVVSIGNNIIRKRIALSLAEKFGTIIHPRAIVSPSACVGNGTVLMAGVIVNVDTRIGDHVILNTGSVIDHDCVIDDFAHVSPNATVCGGVRIGEGTHIGAGATIIQSINVGKWATIGAGSVILSDVPDFAVVTGVPGVIKKYNKQ